MNSRFLTALLVVSLSSLTACSSGESQSDQDGSTLVSQANAQPSHSSVVASDIAGRIFDVGYTLSNPRLEQGYMASAGDILALRSEDNVIIGTAEQLGNHTATVLSVDAQCGDLNSTEDTFVLACPDGVYTINAQEPNLDTKVSIDGGATTAALTRSGVLIAGSVGTRDISIIRPDGSLNTIKPSSSVDQMIAVPNEDGEDGVYFINRTDTTIHQVDWTNNANGAALRVLNAVGQIAPGGDNFLIASDTTSNQLYLFTALPVIMNHQIGVTDSAPWALIWDENNKVAWVSSTAENTLTAYDFSTGTPVKKASINTVSDVRSLAFDGSGNLYIAAKNASVLQVVTAQELASAID